ncbi:MAG TPA: PDZ domain-containing protein [Micropepsaceae bacterium]|nr:PDZ domain-containing protein [Micropepsaceae bacterium]
MNKIFLSALTALGLLGAMPAEAAARGDAFLGAQMAPLTPEVQNDLAIKTTKGAAIGDVVPGSPAAFAGLKSDDVIVGIDKQQVSSPQDVIALVTSHVPGDRIAVQFLDSRKGHRLNTVSVTLGVRPSEFQTDAQPGPQPVPFVKTAANAGSLTQLMPLRNQFCQALAPAGWTIVDQDDRGATFSVGSPDRSMVASYGVVAVNGGQVAGFYGPQYRNPASFVQFLASTVAAQPIQVTGAEPYNGMQVTNFRANNRRGFAIYRAYPLPSDPAGYIVSARIAVAGGEHELPIAGAVAASLDCRTTFKAPPDGYTQVHAKGADTGTSKRCKAGDCSDSDLAGTYNSQLGTGYVHSASGTNYLVDVTSDYHATGPDGPGYYRQVGNSLERLEPGRSD